MIGDFALLTTLSISLSLSLSAFAEESPKFRLTPSQDIQEPGKKKVSEEAQTLAKKATVEFANGKFAEAKKDFQKVLALAPDNVPTTINLGLIEYRERRFAEAETLLKSATRAAPDVGLPWLVLGVVEFEQRVSCDGIIDGRGNRPCSGHDHYHGYE